MFRSALVLAVALAVVPSVSLAKSPMIRALEKAVASGKAFSPERRTLAPQCANFTGNWVGTCTYADGDVEPAEMTIKQDSCSNVSMDGLDFPIGGSYLLSRRVNPNTTDFDFGFTGSIVYEWNDAQTVLKSLASIAIFDGYVAGASTQSIWLAGDQLRVKDGHGTELIDFNGPSQFQWSKLDCTYDRR